MNLTNEIVDILRRCMIVTVEGEWVQADTEAVFDNVRLSALNIDSLASMQFCIELEKRFEWIITPEELLSFESLGEIQRALSAHGNR